MQDYRRLIVWQKAHALAVAVRGITRDFGPQGLRALQSQCVRAAESIVFNISEGCGADSQREFARFLDIAIKSCSEVQAQLDLASGYRAIGHSEWEALDAQVIEVRKMLCGLRRRIRRDLDQGSSGPQTPPPQLTTEH